MLLLNGVAVILALSALTSGAVAGHALPAASHLYPYGPGVGDKTAPVNDDGSTGEIPISTLFPYFDNQHSSLYVNTNGLISFLREVSQFTPDSFPLGGDRRLVAAFWADVDTRKNSGRVYYRETMDSAILQRATHDVRRAFVRLTRFTATWVYIASWHKVTYFGGSSNTTLNTFQIVLVTNGRHSFTIFNYGDIWWTTGTASDGNEADGLGGTPAQVGFNAGDGRRYFSVPGSRQASIVDVETTSNVGRVGRWLFRIDDVSVEAGGCNTKGTLTTGPSYGPMLGGIMVTVAGPCFDDISDTTNLVCKFADIDTPGRVIDATRAECLLPMVLRVGRIPVAISVDGGVNYNYTGIFTLVAEDERHTAAVVDRTNIVLEENTLDISWSSQYFNTTKVDMDCIIFTKSYNKPYVHKRIVPLISSVENVGSLTLPSDIAEIFTTGEVGALRVRASMSSDNRSLWSPIHLAQWYHNMYSTDVIPRRGSTGRPITVDNAPNLAPGRGVIRMYSSRCAEWYEEEKRNPPALQGLPHCPCTRRQARIDTRFEDDPNCSEGSPGCAFFHPGAHHCIRSVSPSSHGAGQLCCYNTAGDILPHEDGGGTLDRAHVKGYYSINVTKVPVVSHLMEDVQPLLWCCKYSNNCAKYGEARPTDNCSAYDPPASALLYGDPHVITMDGFQYTFNGLGEFWLVRSADFKLQGRATKVKNSKGEFINATVWTAIAAKMSDAGSVVQIQINERTGLDIIIDGVKEDFDDLPTQEFTDVTVMYDMDNVTAVIRFHDVLEYVINVGTVVGTLSYSLSWPKEADHPRGLLGNANGDPEDDLQAPDHVTIMANVTKRQLHENFGMKWKTTENESLFVYDAGVSHSSFFDDSFEPLFELPIANTAILENATKICGTYEQCVFDYITTGNEVFARASANAVQQHEKFVEASKKVVSCGFLSSPPNGDKTGSSPLEGATIAFSCKDGFRLIGSVQRTCTGEGTWTGEQTSCKEIKCFRLEAPQGGSVSGGNRTIGSVMTFSCQKEYHIQGSVKRTCTRAGTWDGVAAVCLVAEAKTQQGFRWSVELILAAFTVGLVILVTPPCVVCLVTRSCKKKTPSVSVEMSRPRSRKLEKHAPRSDFI